MFNSMIAGLAGGFIAAACAKLLVVVAAKLKLIPEWIEGRSGVHIPDALHNAFDTAVDLGVQAANAFGTRSFWSSVVRQFRAGKTEDALQAFLTVCKDALVAGSSSLKMPPEWQSIWNEIRRDMATEVTRADMVPHLAIRSEATAAPVKAVLANPTIMASVIDSAVAVDKTHGDWGMAAESIAETRKHLEQLIAESKARQLTLAK